MKCAVAKYKMCNCRNCSPCFARRVIFATAPFSFESSTFLFLIFCTVLRMNAVIFYLFSTVYSEVKMSLVFFGFAFAVQNSNV